jgi:hypothetical protein
LSRSEHQCRRWQPLRHDVGVDEDAGADDAADHDHRGIERPQRAPEARAGSLVGFGVELRSHYVPPISAA